MTAPVIEPRKPKLDKKALEIAASKGHFVKGGPKLGKTESYADYLIGRGKEYEERRASKAAAVQDEKDEIAECTFTPTILPVTSAEDEKSPGSARKPKRNKWD